VLAQAAQEVESGGVEAAEGCHARTLRPEAVTCLARAVPRLSRI
jgi:hypothetical protein